MLADWITAEVPERTRAALRLLECMTVRPLALDTSFVNELKQTGLDELAMREVANIGFHYNLINRVADAFDFPVPQGKQKARLAKALNTAGKRLKGIAAETVWVRAEDGRIRPTEVEHGRERLFSAAGKTDPALRYAIEAFVLAQWGYVRDGSWKADPLSIPSELQPYLKKLALYAYRITDKEINALRAVGYTDETIYEITIVGSFAAALVGLEQLFAALYDDELEETVVSLSSTSLVPELVEGTSDRAMVKEGR